LDNQIEKNKIDRACSRYGGDERCVLGFGGETTGFDGRIILRWIFRTWDGKVSTGLMCLRTGIGGGLL